MQKILISNPSSMYLTFLPYIHGLLKLYAQTNEKILKNYEWLDPVYLFGNPEELISEYNLSEIDVLGLSCYVWNFPIQCAIAKKVKLSNPNCLVVAGGPEPDWNDKYFFEKHPYIDIVVTHDGEIPFKKILLEKLKGVDSNYSQIPGVITKFNGNWHRNYNIEKINNWSEMSPYCDDPQILKILASHPNEIPKAVIWETNRGCPYSCVFCDWGSNVNTKIRAFPENKINREIDWFANHHIYRVYITDANYGILPRDEKIIDQICEIHQEKKWPKVVDWCAAKNNIQRVTNICVKLNQSNLNKGVLIGYQSTNNDVLNSMSRINMSEDKHRVMVDKLKSEGVHIFAAIILGSPDDNLPSFRKTVCDLLEMGFHDSIRCYLYAILPNAPANSPNYLAKYNIITKKSKIVGPVKNTIELDSPYFPKIDYIVSHSSMSKKDWINQCLFYGLVSGVHNLGLLQKVALFYRTQLNTDYLTFYSKLFDYFYEKPNTVLGAEFHFLKNWLESFLNEDEASFFVRADEDNLLYEHEKWLFIRLNEKRKAFYLEVIEFLKDNFSQNPYIEDLVDYQKFSIIPISEKFESSRKFNYNWVEIFNQISSENKILGEIDKTSCEITIAVDYANQYPWLHLKDSKERRVSYVRNVLGSMIYKSSSSLLPEKSMSVKRIKNKVIKEGSINGLISVVLFSFIFLTFLQKNSFAKTSNSNVVTKHKINTGYQVTSEDVETMRQELIRLKNSQILKLSLKEGDKIPDFQLNDAQENLVDSKDLLGREVLVIVFYRGNWCPYCNIQLNDIQSKYSQIKELGGKLIAISPQTPDYTKETVLSKGLQFTVLSDPGAVVAEKFGLRFRVGKELQDLYIKMGVDLKKFNGDQNWFLPLGATYIVNAKGVISKVFIDIDYKKRATGQEIINALRDLRNKEKE